MCKTAFAVLTPTLGCRSSKQGNPGGCSQELTRILGGILGSSCYCSPRVSLEDGPIHAPTVVGRPQSRLCAGWVYAGRKQLCDSHIIDDLQDTQSECRITAGRDWRSRSPLSSRAASTISV